MDTVPLLRLELDVWGLGFRVGSRCRKGRPWFGVSESLIDHENLT